MATAAKAHTPPRERFPRLAPIIAEFQCDVLYRGEKLALAEFLPLDAAKWITCGNALRLDWLSVCPPTGAGVKVRGDDLSGGIRSSPTEASPCTSPQGSQTSPCPVRRSAGRVRCPRAAPGPGRRPRRCAALS